MFLVSIARRVNSFESFRVDWGLNLHELRRVSDEVQRDCLSLCCWNYWITRLMICVVVRPLSFSFNPFFGSKLKNLSSAFECGFQWKIELNYARRLHPSHFSSMFSDNLQLDRKVLGKSHEFSFSFPALDKQIEKWWKILLQFQNKASEVESLSASGSAQINYAKPDWNRKSV